MKTIEALPPDKILKSTNIPAYSNFFAGTIIYTPYGNQSQTRV
ncbi:MAG TPA: hypothetical protein PLJ39_00810 [Spirochaetota bacterium]|nr:hypothetical protein [Spirochaetota bacterium]